SVAAPGAASPSRNTRRVWPTRISSPCRNRREAQIRSPLTHVPFEDPRSVTHHPAANRSRTAWRWLAVGSSSNATSFSAALPTVVRSASSENRQLLAPEITSICGFTGQAYVHRRGRGGSDCRLRPEYEDCRAGDPDRLWVRGHLHRGRAQRHDGTRDSRPHRIRPRPG